MGVHASTNLKSISEGFNDDDDDDTTWIGGVSAISIEEGGWCDDGFQKNEVNELASAIGANQSTFTGFKSSGFKSKAFAMNKGDGKVSKGQVIYTNKSLNLEYLLCSWCDLNLNKRVSIQFRVESGNDAHKSYLTRVSTSGLELVIDRSMSKDSLDSISSLLIEFVGKEENDVSTAINKLISENPLIRMHPKMLAFDHAVAAVTARDQKAVTKSCRIPLPIKCRHTYAVKEDGDNFFFGKKFIVHKDGSIWCHVELVGVQRDNFNVSYTPDDETIINKEKIPASISIGSDMEEESFMDLFDAKSRAGSPSVAMSRVSSNTSKSKKSSIKTRSMRANEGKKTESPKSVPPPNNFTSLVTPNQVANLFQSRVLDGAYSGGALRTKSVKLAKRTAANQDTGASSMV